MMAFYAEIFANFLSLIDAWRWSIFALSWLSPSDLIQWISIERRDSFISFVAILLLLQIYLLLALLIYVFYKRLSRAWSRRNNYQRAQQLQMLLGEYMLHPNKIVKVRRGDFLFFRRLLLNELEGAEVKSRANLQALYRKLGFFEMDLKQLKSRQWSTKLAAIVRLETLKSQDAARAIFEYIHDPNDLVSIAAMRAMSALEFPENLDEVLDSLARRAPARKDILIEILTNIGRMHSEKIMSYLVECYDPFIAVICLSVLGDLKETKAIPLCKQLLNSSVPEVVTEAAHTLERLRLSL